MNALCSMHISLVAFLLAGIIIAILVVVATAVLLIIVVVACVRLYRDEQHSYQMNEGI